MPKKIRVYELARELGLTNKEALDLCLDLGIGVTSHSSSIEDAQGDRVRRKADREGLRRDKQPEEPAEVKGRPGRGGRAADGADGSDAVAVTSPVVAPAPAPGRPLTAPVAEIPQPPDRVSAPPALEPLAPAASIVRGSGAPRGGSVTAPPAPRSEPAASQPLAPDPPGAAVTAPASSDTGAPPAPAVPLVPAASSAHTAAGVAAGPAPASSGPVAAPTIPSLPSAAAGAPSASTRPGSTSGASPASTRPGPTPGSSPGPSGSPRPPLESASGRPIPPPPGPPRGGPPISPPRGASRPGDPRLVTSRPSDTPSGTPGSGDRTGRRPPSASGPRPGQSTGSPAGNQPGYNRGGPPPRTPGRPGATGRPGGPPGSAPPPSGPRSGPGNAGGRAPGGPPLSPSGKPIPPPPGAHRPPLSPSGKPIPPPPGLGGRGPASGSPRPGQSSGRPSGPPARSGPGGATTGRPGFGNRPSTGGFNRPGGGPGGGSAPGSGFPRPGGGPGGAGTGAPGAGRGGPPTFGGRGGRPPQRRVQRRRRRNAEELEAQELTRYTPSDAPIPEGEVIIERGSTAQEVGPKLNRSAADVVRFLFQQGEMVAATQSLSDDMIELFAAEVRANIRLVDAGQEKEAELQAKYFDDVEDNDESLLRPRPPVVTVMGHVDHGKTLLLDRIRETNVVASEAGGITQHIGAYQVEVNDQLITFIDTPGHEAFTAMRARGAEVTDIVVLVVAADDGVMPQTVEAINHAKAAGVPIVVALNKIDRDNADPNRVKQQLSEQGLVPEEWGGDTIMVEISALQKLGIDDLLEQLLVVAELEDLRENPEGRARGVVLEANLDVGRGPVATVIVQKGTLRVADAIVAGAAWGRVRALIDDQGDNVKEALPSTPVQVLGFDEVPAAGDEFRVTAKEKTARDIAELREQRFRSADLRKTSSATGTGAKLEDIFEQIQRGETATLNLVLKADVQGSLEAVTESLRKLERDEVKLAFIHRAVGGITENDVTLAAASNATIIGFNVRPERKARDLAADQDVEVRTYEIIYKLIEDIESAMVGMLTPEFEEVITGEAEVREIFRIPRVGAVAGCYVRSGVITRGSKVRFLREGVIIWKGSITSLKRFKDDAREVQSGFECGIGLSNNQDLRQGDVIETFDVREIPRT